MGDWNWRQLRNAPPRWSDLYHLSHIPMLRYPLMFLVVVPFAVKLIIFLKNRKILTTDIPLPIAVEFLFVSAVATILAALVYTFRCPRLVKDYLEYGDFEKTKKGSQNLADEFAADIRACTPPPKWTANNLRQISEDYGTTNIEEGTFEKIKNKQVSGVEVARSIKIAPTNLPQAFWAMRNFVDDLRPASRYVYLGFLLIAILCAVYVLLRNIVIVLRYIVWEV